MPSPRNAARLFTLLFGFALTSATAGAQMSAIFATTRDDGPCSSLPASPRFSIKPGRYPAPLSVSLTDHSRGAIIFYTTDGWTPTANSTRYLGPISIDKTTTVEAIALVPNCSISKPATATYVLPAGSQPVPVAELLHVLSSGDGSLALRTDAQIPLIFASPVDSRTAHVGDRIVFTLAEDLKIGDTLFALKGTPAIGKVIQVDRSGVGDLPGEVQFQVDFLNVNGTRIPLHAVGALAGPYVAKTATTAIGVYTTAGLSLLFEHGKDARIPAGASLTANMAAGTLLPATNNSVASNGGPGIR